MNKTERLREIEHLYRQAFADYGAVALWNMKPVENRTPGAALAITSALRTHGSMDGRRLAEHIERLCREPYQGLVRESARRLKKYSRRARA